MYDDDEIEDYETEESQDNYLNFTGTFPKELLNSEE
tara:strand:+ start:283 stop:390 length:108 start_codon:yes stop_codon:yes gene_type:complete